MIALLKVERKTHFYILSNKAKSENVFFVSVCPLLLLCSGPTNNQISFSKNKSKSRPVHYFSLEVIGTVKHQIFCQNLNSGFTGKCF